MAKLRMHAAVTREFANNLLSCEIHENILKKYWNKIEIHEFIWRFDRFWWFASRREHETYFYLSIKGLICKRLDMLMLIWVLEIIVNAV